MTVIAFDDRVRFEPLKPSIDVGFSRLGHLVIPTDEADPPGWIVDGQQRTMRKFLSGGAYEGQRQENVLAFLGKRAFLQGQNGVQFVGLALQQRRDIGQSQAELFQGHDLMQAGKLGRAETAPSRTIPHWCDQTALLVKAQRFGCYTQTLRCFGRT